MALSTEGQVARLKAGDDGLSMALAQPELGGVIFL